jgi:hypothetical protein
MLTSDRAAASDALTPVAEVNSEKLATRAHKRLHKALPELRPGYNMLFVPPVDHILGCFALETRSAPKHRAYFCRVVMPLYRPRAFLVLNYGQRLLGGETVSLSEADLDRTIDRLSEAAQGELDLLRRVRSPKDFLEYVNWDDQPKSPRYRIDLALTHYLAGDAPACREVLEELLARPPNPWWAEQNELAQELMRELNHDPAALTRRIEAWEQSAKKLLQITPPPRRRRVHLPGISARFA